MKKIAKKLKTQSDIVSEIAKKKKLPLSTADLLVNAVFGEISQALLKGRRAELRGFGSFEVKRYKAYKGRNPKTRQKITVRAKRRPRFRPGLFFESLSKR